MTRLPKRSPVDPDPPIAAVILNLMDLNERLVECQRRLKLLWTRVEALQDGGGRSPIGRARARDETRLD